MVHDPAKKKVKVTSWLARVEEVAVLLVFFLCSFPETASQAESAVAFGAAAQNGSCCQSGGGRETRREAARHHFRMRSPRLRCKCLNASTVKFLFPFFCLKVIKKKKKASLKHSTANAYLVSLVDGCAAHFNPLKEMF